MNAQLTAATPILLQTIDNALVPTLFTEVRFIVSTFKPKDWQAFIGLAHTLAIITVPEESVAMIT